MNQTITFEVTEERAKLLSEMTEDYRNKFINRAIDISENICSSSKVDCFDFELRKDIISCIYNLQKRSIASRGQMKLYLDDISDIVRIRHPNISNFTVSKCMKDMYLKCESGTGNYRVLNLTTHKKIIEYLYEFYKVC